MNDLLAWLRRRGYAEPTIRSYLKAAGPICRWLQRRLGRALRGLSQRDLRAAYAHFRRRRVEQAAACRSFGHFLTEHQLIRPEKPEPPSHTERQIGLFGDHLREVHGLALQTVLGHQRRLRAFFQSLKLEERPSAIPTLTLDRIEALLRHSAQTNNRFSMQHIVASLRAFLQQQHAAGCCVSHCTNTLTRLRFIAWSSCRVPRRGSRLSRCSIPSIVPPGQSS